MVNFLSQGEDVYVSKNVTIRNSEKSSVGSHIAIDDFFYSTPILNIKNYVHISSNVSIIGGVNSNLNIGNFVGIGTGTRIICGSSDFFNDGLISLPVLPKHLQKNKFKLMNINDFAITGANCVILNGVSLGEGSVIAAGSVVTKDTEPWTMYKGVPARPYKKINRTQKLIEAKSLGYPFIFSHTTENNIDAEAYHKTIYNSDGTPKNWHKNNMKSIIEKIDNYVTHRDLKHITITDYGTGTGGSILEVISMLKRKGIKYTIYLVDILESWFHKAYELFKDDNDIHFILNSTRIDGKFKQVPIDLILSRNSDVVICGNMIHLIPETKFISTMTSLKNITKPDGIIVMNSGNVDYANRTNLLFDEPFKQIANGDKKIVNKIFPTVLRKEKLSEILNTHFKTVDIFHEKVSMNKETFYNFYCIPRLKNNLIISENKENFIKNKLEKFPNELTFDWTTILISS